MKFYIESERIGFSVWDNENEQCAYLLWGNKVVTKYISVTGNMTEEQIEKRLEKEKIHMKNIKFSIFLYMRRKAINLLDVVV